MNLYEKIVIIDPNIDDTAAEETVGKIKDIIINKGGEILKTENWGRRRLAYILNKHQKGNYVLILFKSPPATIMDLERFCKVTDSVIKFMVVKLTKKKQIESVLASIKEAETKKQAETAAADTEGVKLKEENLSTSEEKESV
jgi:small subunit ribosomal protein S6